MKKLFALLMLLVMAFSLTACGKQSAEAYIKNELDQFKKGEGLESSAEDLSPEVLQELLDNFSYNILSSTEDGDNATVEVEITNLDMITAVNNWLGQLLIFAFDQSLQSDNEQLSEEELNAVMYDMLYACMTAEDIKPVTTPLSLNLLRVDGQWQLDSVSMNKLTDAMMGGFFTAMATLG